MKKREDLAQEIKNGSLNGFALWGLTIKTHH